MKDSNFIKENNGRHMWHAMAHPAEMQNNPPKVISEGEGYSITDIDGNRLIDGVGGLWNTNLGYSCDPVKEAITRQLEKLPYYNTFRGATNEPSVELSYDLREFFQTEDLTRCFYTSGGSDSVETGLRLARQYHRLNGEPERTKFFSLHKGYHGTHYGGASVNGDPKFRRNYAPMLPGCYHLPSPYAYRSEFETSDPEAIAKGIAKRFEIELAFQSSDTVAALIVEPVQGAGGVIVPHESLFRRLREVCDRHGILMIADEIITAFGRTGSECGSRLWGTKPDMLTTAKGLTNGYFPMGALMISNKLAEAFEDNKDSRGAIFHGYTYSGHPVAAAAAIAAVAEVRRLKVWENAAARGDQLLVGLKALQARYPIIGDVRGQGLMAAMEIVIDPETKQPADKAVINQFFEAVYDNGVMLRTSGHTLIISPCLIIDEAGIDGILEACDAGFKALSA